MAGKIVVAAHQPAIPPTRSSGPIATVLMEAPINARKTERIRGPLTWRRRPIRFSGRRQAISAPTDACTRPHSPITTKNPSVPRFINGSFDAATAQVPRSATNSPTARSHGPAIEKVPEALIAPPRGASSLRSAQPRPWSGRPHQGRLPPRPARPAPSGVSRATPGPEPDGERPQVDLVAHAPEWSHGRASIIPRLLVPGPDRRLLANTPSHATVVTNWSATMNQAIVLPRPDARAVAITAPLIAQPVALPTATTRQAAPSVRSRAAQFRAPKPTYEAHPRRT